MVTSGAISSRRMRVAISLAAANHVLPEDPMRKKQRSEIWSLVLAGRDGTRLRSLTQRVAGAPIPQLDQMPAMNVLVQPGNRDTGPGRVFSLVRIARQRAGAGRRLGGVRSCYEGARPTALSARYVV
jgi:hypothetical protein